MEEAKPQPGKDVESSVMLRGLAAAVRFLNQPGKDVQSSVMLRGLAAAVRFLNQPGMFKVP